MKNNDTNNERTLRTIREEGANLVAARAIELAEETTTIDKARQVGAGLIKLGEAIITVTDEMLPAEEREKGLQTIAKLKG